MDQIWVCYTPTILTITLLLTLLTKIHRKQNNKKPPGPQPIPIIGHLHLITQPLHRFLQDLSSQYGSIYSLKFGFRSVVVISSPTIVEECFTTHDIVLANRPRLLVGQHLNYDWTTLGAASYGPLWRDLRRITTLEFFSNSRLNSLSYIRTEEIKLLAKNMVEKIGDDQFTEVEMRPKFPELSFNVIMRMVVGMNFLGTEEAKMFRGVARDVFELSGASNAMDCFPFLKWFGLSKAEKKMLSVRKTMDYFLDGLIEECKRNKDEDGENRRPMIYKLLNLQELDPVNPLITRTN